MKYVNVDAAKSLQNAASVRREIYPHVPIELVAMESLDAYYLKSLQKTKEKSGIP